MTFKDAPHCPECNRTTPMEQLCIGVLIPKNTSVVRCSMPLGCGRSYYWFDDDTLRERERED